MFGSLANRILPERLGIAREDLVVVSIMPCTAKKYEAKLGKFVTNAKPDVDHVLTTQELARMIDETGLRFQDLEPQSLDLPLGYKTGAGVIFGASGGVTEAVLRYAVEKLQGVSLDSVDFLEVRGEGGVREAALTAGGVELKLAVVNGLKNAIGVVEKIRRGECRYDLIEVMACPGGCVCGAGQPVTRDSAAGCRRAKGLYAADKMMQLHKAQDNHIVTECYAKYLEQPGSHTAHKLLHTDYQNRRRISGESLVVLDGEAAQNRPKLPVSVCIGTSCFLRGSQTLLKSLIAHVEEQGLDDAVGIEATFCFENCDCGPTIHVGAETLHHCTLEMAREAIRRQLAGQGVAVEA